MENVVELRKTFVRDGCITLEDMSIHDLFDVTHLGSVSAIFGSQADNYKLEDVYIYNNEPIVSVDAGNGMVYYGPADSELKESIHSYRIKLAKMSRMLEKWIGEECNPSGTYIQTECIGLSERRGGPSNAQKLYRFTNKFKQSYYITDIEAVENIERLLTEGSPTLYEYLYKLVIERFGISNFITDIENRILEEKENSFMEGKAQLQFEMKQLLGIRGY